MALGLLAIPSLILMLTCMRQLEFSPLGWFPQACYGHECQLLLGTIFVLSQLATLIYFLVVYGVCALMTAICDKYFITNKKTTRKNCHSSEKSFRAIFLHSRMHQLCLLALAVSPLTAVVCFAINIFTHGNEGVAWNRMVIASYCFISLILLILIHLVILACKPSPMNSEQRRSELLVLFLSLVKATFGKVLYAFSLTTHWG